MALASNNTERSSRGTQTEQWEQAATENGTLGIDYGAGKERIHGDEVCILHLLTPVENLAHRIWGPKLSNTCTCAVYAKNKCHRHKR